MKKIKPLKNTTEAHVSKTNQGMGDYYGTGIKQKVGRMREGMGMIEVTPKNLKKPPKSLA